MKLRRRAAAVIICCALSLGALSVWRPRLDALRSTPSQGWTSPLCDTPVANSILLKELLKRDPSWSRCAGLNWLTGIGQYSSIYANDNPFFCEGFNEPCLAVVMTSEPLVYVDVGCGLGYSLAYFLAASGIRSGLNPASLHGKLEDMGIPSCGGCGDCRLSPLPPNITTPIDAYGIEAAPLNYKALLRVQEVFSSQTSAEESRFSVLNYYVGNGSTEAIQAPSLASGEDVSLHDLPSWETPVEVAAITLDRLAALEFLRVIDVLNINIRGDGPEVLEGASDLLKSQRINTILLTYTKTGGWAAPQALQNVLDNLRNYGYFCFWAGKTGLIPITSCFVETYAQISMGRMVCAPVTSPMFQKLAALII